MSRKRRSRISAKPPKASNAVKERDGRGVGVLVIDIVSRPTTPGGVAKKSRWRVVPLSSAPLSPAASRNSGRISRRLGRNLHRGPTGCAGTPHTLLFQTDRSLAIGRGTRAHRPRNV
jgi:hypothetical protein